MLNAYERVRRCAGLLLALGGILLFFVCLPVEVLVMALGAALFALGVILLRR